MFQTKIGLILLTFVLTFTAFGQGSEDANHGFGLAEKDWKIEFNLDGWKALGTRSSEDGSAKRFDAEIKPQGFRLTIMMVTAQSEGSSADLRELASKTLKKSPVKKDDFKFAEYGEIPTIEYLIKEFQGIKLNQKHQNAYIVRDGVWIDIHLSKVRFKTGDEKRFFAILDSLKFVD